MSAQTPAPKEGIYLDAALAVVGEQIAERIDDVERRRRTRRGIGTAMLALAVVASGSVAAVALATRDAEEIPAKIAYEEPAFVRCVEAPDAADAAYFTVRYRVSTGVRVDGVGLCRKAWETVSMGGEGLQEKTPEELSQLAEGLVLGESDAAHGASVLVTEVAFGRVSGGSPPALRPCEEEIDPQDLPADARSVEQLCGREPR